jgi:tetratricopeptide (TPR) repeat protein
VRQRRLETIQYQAFDNYRDALAFAGRWPEVRTLVAEQLAQRREIATEPNAGPEQWNDYAWLLLTCEPEDLRDPDEARMWATRAVEQAGDLDAELQGLCHDTQARAFAMLGDPERAVVTQRRAVEILRTTEDEEVTEYAVSQLVTYAMQAGEEDGVGELVQEQLSAIRDAHGDDSSARANALRLLGQELADRGLHHQSGGPLRLAAGEARNLSDRTELLRILITYASSLARAGDVDAAHRVLDEATALYGDLYVGEPIDWQPGIGYTDSGERSSDAVDAKRDLALAMIDAGRLEDADEFTREVAAVSRWRARPAYGRLYLAQGQPVAAEPWLRISLFQSRRSDWVQDAPWRFASLESDYGLCLAELGRLDEAEKMLSGAHARAMEWCGPQSSTTRLAAARLHRVRQAQGAPSVALDPTK